MSAFWFFCFVLFLTSVRTQDEAKKGVVIVTQKPSTNTTTMKPTTTTIDSNIQKVSKEMKLLCPKQKPPRRLFFQLPCRFNKDCSFLGANTLCCDKQCVPGVAPPPPKQSHSPLFGIIHRECPTHPIAEIFPIQECTKDDDCVPRLCCPENVGSERKSYCRTGAPKLDKMPRAKQFLEPLMPFINYMQCSAPPPSVLDIFPKVCKSPLDCFPNLCCQEAGRRVCRPPRKSFLSLVAGVATRLGTSTIVKRFIQRISR